MPQGMSIEQLPAATRTKLRSTQILTSLPQVISELLQNSLDAGARQVEVGVDCEEWSCWIRDDGTGISKDGLAVIAGGSEHGRYGTSKAYAPPSLDAVSTFGFRGEALASASDLSCLEISSRTSRSPESWSVILKGGKCLYNGSSVRWRRESPGTVVCIRDAFYNLPIRRLSHPSPFRSLELIRQEIEAYALVFPSVSFSLEDTSGARDSSASKHRVTRIPKTQSTLAAFRHLYGRALVEHAEEINETSGEMKLEGFMSLNGAHSKVYQFLYINRHPLATCDLHRIIDNKFTASSFAKHAFDESGETSLPRPTLRRSPRKTERKPVYVLNLTIPPRHIDNCLEPAKAAVQFQNKDAVSSFLSNVAQSFLIRHGFLSQKQPSTKSAQEAASPSRKRRKISPESGIGRIASIFPSTGLKTACGPAAVASAPLLINPEISASLTDDELLWKDPATGETFVVDRRTGNSYPQAKQRDGDEGRDHPPSEGPARRRTIISSRGLHRDPCVHGDLGVGLSEVIPGWIQEALQDNEVYALTEVKIPSLPLSSAFASNLQERPSSNHYHHACHETGMAGAHYNGSSRRFKRDNLRNARIISQVDRKFIACLIDDGCMDMAGSAGSVEGHGLNKNSSDRALVLIDQHAADERVRVERFLKDLCLGFLHHTAGGNSSTSGVQIKHLSPPAPVLLTRREAFLLGSSSDIRRAFESWGIEFSELPQIEPYEKENGIDGATHDAYTQISVRTIPKVVSEKLLIGDELRELVKGFIAKMEADGPAFFLPSVQQSIDGSCNIDDEGFIWLKALRWCPRELMDLINSKACRGAIMFNDSLSLEQCTKLVRQLSETALPFQCAHGRPSLVPLTSIGVGGQRRKHAVEWSRLER